MAKGKLKAALDAHKGVDYKQAKDKKKQKEAIKRKQTNGHNKPKPTAAVEEEDGLEELSEDDEEGGVLIDETAVGTEIAAEEERKLQAELKALLTNKKKLMEIDSGSEVDEDDDEVDGGEDEWESAAEDLDDEDEGESSGEEEPGFDFSRLEDSDSDDDDDESDQEEAHTTSVLTKKITVNSNSNGMEEEDAEGEDIPLSDIESLASDERGDVIPHQRLTINNTAALKAAYDRIVLPTANLSFSIHQSVTSKTNTANSIPDIDDDLNRELAFYAQSLEAAKRARTLLTKEGVPFTRPNDYFAEMVKSDEHMGRVKDKLRDEAAGKKAAAEARRQRDLKKFGKQVQVAKMQERAKEKRETLDRINVLKRKRAGAMPSAENEPDLFDVSLEDAATTARKDREERKNRASGGSRGKGEPNSKRQKKDEKFGYGGRKRFAKSGDAMSSADMRDHPGKNMKKPFKSGGGSKVRPGKARRAKARL